MTITISYARLKAYMQNDLQYSEEEAVHAISQLRKAGPAVQTAFARYWKTGVIPHTPVNGVRIDKLMELRGLDAVAAFLAAESLKRRPKASKWFLTHPMDIRRTTREDMELLEELARRRGWNLDRDVPPEDKADLVLDDRE